MILGITDTETTGLSIALPIDQLQVGGEDDGPSISEQRHDKGLG